MTLLKQFKYAGKLLIKLLSLKVIKLSLLILFLLVMLPLIFFWVNRPKPAKHINYGINFSHKYATDLGLDWKDAYLKIMDDLKPKYARLVVYWDDSESNNDKYGYSDILWQLDHAKARDVKVIMTMGRKVLRYPECYEPKWWRELKDDNLKEAALLEYIKNTTLQLKGYDNIIMWQVENEPFFPFGICEKSKKSTVEKEIKLVKSLDSRPVLTQDSGEGGFWRPTYLMGDYLGISMYRKIWYDLGKNIFGTDTYFKYPLAHWSYKIKAAITGIPVDKIIVTELQTEPWGPGINSKLSEAEKQKTMSKEMFLDNINYAQKSGFENVYFWGAEWWLFEKEFNNNSYYWETAKAVIQN